MTPQEELKRALAFQPVHARPRWGFGARLRMPNGWVGTVDAIYASYWAALAAHIVPPGWFEGLTVPSSSRDQIFYGIVGDKGHGAALVGEEDAEEVKG